MKVLLMRALALLLLTRAFCKDHDIIIKPNANNAHEEKLLIFLPGGKVPNTYYEKTVKAIQDQTNLALWVGIAAFPLDLCDPVVPGPGSAQTIVKKLEAAARAEGFKGPDNGSIFIAGHSLGGSCANAFFGQGYAGFILYGSCAAPGYSGGLAAVKEPIMCLAGEFDRGLVPGVWSVSYSQYLDYKRTHTDSVAKKPVMMAYDMVHSDFCPGFQVKGMFEPRLAQNASLAIIGQTTSSFLHLNTNQSAAAQAKATEAIQKYLLISRELLVPFLTLEGIQNHTTCELAQRYLTGLPETLKDNLNITQYDYEKAKDPPPSLEHSRTGYAWADGSQHYILDVNVTSCAEMPKGQSAAVARGIDDGYVSADDTACKMLSADRIAQQFGMKSYKNLTCRDMNVQLIDLARSTAAPRTLQRFDARGKPFKLLPDKATIAGPGWIKNRLKFDTKSNKSEVKVTSYHQYSPLNSKIFPGIFYCKLLSPARALEWMQRNAIPLKAPSR